MRVQRIEFDRDYRLGAAEATYSFQERGPSENPHNLPIARKNGIEIHLVLGGDWVLLREKPPEGQPEAQVAALLIPRERVVKLYPLHEQVMELLTEPRPRR